MRIGDNFAIWDRCNCGWDMCNERVFFEVKVRSARIHWFMDCGEWFFYLYLGKRWWRFSSAGYMRGWDKSK